MCKRHEPLIELFQRAFATDGIAEEYSEKVDDFIAPEAASGHTHLRVDSSKDTLLAKIINEERDLTKPGRRRGNRLSRGLDLLLNNLYRSIGDTGHMYLLERMEMVFLPQRGTFLILFATGYISLRNSWDVEEHLDSNEVRSGTGYKHYSPANVSGDWPTCSITVDWTPLRLCEAFYRNGAMSTRSLVCDIES